MSGADDADMDAGADAESYRVEGKADGGAGLRLPGRDGDDVPVVLSEDVADEVDVDALESAVPDDAPFTFTLQGKADEDGTATIPVSGGVDHDTASPTLSKTDFDRIRDERIQGIRESSVNYDHRIADWIMAKDDLVPGIAERMTALVLGEAGLQVEPADADSEADKKLADWLQSEIYGSEVDPSEVVRTGIRENIKHALAVYRATDLRDLDTSKLTYVADGMTGDEVYIQDAQSVTTLNDDAIDDGNADADVRDLIETEEVDRQVLTIGDEVFRVQLYKNAPLEAVADDVVNKLVLKRLKARRAEIASIGGIYIKVNPPAGLPEEEYFSKEEVDWADEPKTKLEIAMRNGIEDAFDTLSDYKAGSIMAIPENWEVNSVELPDDDEPLDQQIRGYNKSIANRLLFPLDLFELQEGAELSRDTIFKTLLTTIEGWRQEFIRVFDAFAEIQKEIYDVSGDVEHSFPALGAEDEKILVQLLAHSGAAGLSRSEIRQIMNRVEGVDLEIDVEPQDAPPAGGPQDPQEREKSIRDALPTDGDGDGVTNEGEADDGQDSDSGVDTSTSKDASRVLDDDVLADLAASGLESFKLGTVGGTFPDDEIDAAVDALQEIPGVDAKRSADNHDPGVLVTVDRSLTDRRLDYDQRIADAVAGTPFSVGDGESFDWEERAWASYVTEHSGLDLDADFVSASSSADDQDCWVCGADATHRNTTPPYEFTCSTHATSSDFDPISAESTTDDGGLIQKFRRGLALIRFGGDSNPLAGVPGLPDDPKRLTREMLAYWLLYLKSQDAQASIEADWNPAFHPRGPDGQFVERPFDIPDAIRESNNLDFGNQSGAEILRQISDFEKTAVKDLLQDSDIRIDDVPDDVDTRSDLIDVADQHKQARDARKELARDHLSDQVDQADSLGDVPTRTVSRESIDQGDILLVDGEPREVDSPGFNAAGYGRVKTPDGETVDGFQAPEQVERVQGARTMYDLPSVDLPPSEGGRNDVSGKPLDELANVILPGQESALKDPDEGPIDDDLLADARDSLNDVLSRANDPDVAREYARRTAYIADEINRAHNGPRSNPKREQMNGMALSPNSGASTIVHEMGHGVAQSFGFSDNDNSAAHNMDYWPDIDPESDEFREYMVGEGLALGGGTQDATGFDDWKDAEFDRVARFADDQFEDWDGRNTASALEAGDVVRFDDSPTVGTSSRTLEVVGVDPNAGVRDDNVELELRTQDGDVVSQTFDNDGSGFFADIASVNRGATDRDAAANRESTAWTSDRTPDVADLRGPADRSPKEKVRDLVSAANRAFYNMHLTRKYQDDDSAQLKTILSGYSSTNAHEVLSQVNELLQTDADAMDYATEAKVRRLSANHPALVAKYLDIWKPSPAVREILAEEGVAV